jgi:replication factor C small subunit
MNSVWAVKHRPTTLADMVGQEEILIEMRGIVTHQHHHASHGSTLMQHFIFHSREPGTGKTSMAFALAADLDWPIHLYNASSKHTRGIAFVEEELRPLSSMGMHQQIIFLDEADQLTADA